MWWAGGFQMEFIKNNKNVLVVVAIIIIVGAIMLPNRSQNTSETDKKPTTSENKTEEVDKKTAEKKSAENSKKQETVKDKSSKPNTDKQATDKKEKPKAEDKVVVKTDSESNDKSGNKSVTKPKENTKKDTNKEQAPSKPAVNEDKSAYNFTASAGDSYTVLARQAIMKYSKDNKQNLSKAQIIAAETFLTQEVGSPQINEGQSVYIKKSAVSSVVTKAKALSPNVLAAWQVYVPLVNFNL